MTEKLNGTGTNWQWWFGKGLEWKHKQVMGKKEACLHLSYSTVIGALIRFRGMWVKVSTTERYSKTTSQHRPDYDVEAPVWIEATESQLDELQGLLVDRHYHKIRRRVPAWFVEKVNHELRRQAIVQGTVADGWKWNINYLNHGKNKGICGRVAVTHRSIPSHNNTTYCEVFKGDFISAPDVPAEIRALLIPHVYAYYEHTRSH